MKETSTKSKEGLTNSNSGSGSYPNRSSSEITLSSTTSSASTTAGNLANSSSPGPKKIDKTTQQAETVLTNGIPPLNKPSSDPLDPCINDAKERRYFPNIAPEILRTTSERHQKGLMSPWIYQILSQVSLKIPLG